MPSVLSSGARRFVLPEDAVHPAVQPHGVPLQALSSGDKKARLKVRVTRPPGDSWEPVGVTADMMSVALLIQQANALWGELNQTGNAVSRVFVPRLSGGKPSPEYGVVAQQEDGAFVSVSTQWVRDLNEGLQRFTERPWDSWTSQERTAFLMANHAAVHEAFHAVSGRDGIGTNWDAWSKGKALEEPLAELASYGQDRRFFRSVYGFDPGSDFERFKAVRGHSAEPIMDPYTRKARTLQAFLKAVQATEGVDVAELARRLGHEMPVEERVSTLVGWLEKTRETKLSEKFKTEASRDLVAVVSVGDRAAYGRLRETFPKLPRV